GFSCTLKVYFTSYKYSGRILSMREVILRRRKANSMSTPHADQPLNASQMLAEARKVVPEITATHAKEQLDSGQVDLILDVREPNEWDKGHIPGAVLAPRGLLEWYADSTSPYSRPEITAKR